MLNTTVHEFRALVRNWQEAHGLTVDGKLGPKTRASLARYIGKLPEVTPPPPPPGELAFGLWPIRFEERSPVVTDGFGRSKRGGKGHLGVDLMYRRVRSGAVSLPEHTRHFWCPSGKVLAVACVAGKVVRIVRSKANGIAVYVSHGRYMTVYRHLTICAVALDAEVMEGATLGIVGHAPGAGKKGINHLHFEIWDTDKKGITRWNRNKQAIDPLPFLNGWIK